MDLYGPRDRFPGSDVQALGLALVTLRTQLRSGARSISERITRVAYGRALPAPRLTAGAPMRSPRSAERLVSRRCLRRSRRYGALRSPVMPPVPHLCYQELTVFFNQTRHLIVGFMVLIPVAYAAQPLAKKSVRVICEEHPSCKRKSD